MFLEKLPIFTPGQYECTQSPHMKSTPQLKTLDTVTLDFLIKKTKNKKPLPSYYNVSRGLYSKHHVSIVIFEKHKEKNTGNQTRNSLAETGK